jgi:L-xylulokinase
MGKYLLGLDCGHTITKAVLFDFAGNEIASGKGLNEVISTHPGWQERSMIAAADAAIIAIAEAVKDIDTNEISAIGVCGHSDGLYLLDSQNKPLRNAIFATDNRAAEIAEELARTVGGQILPRIGQYLFPASPGALLVWLKRNEPENFKKIGAVLHCKDWINAVLTENVGSEVSDASGSYADLNSHEISDEVLSMLGLSELKKVLSKPVFATTQLGKITQSVATKTGLKEGTPVIAGSHDVHAAAIGVGAYDVGETSLIFGTWSINQVFADKPSPDMRWHTRASVAPGRWLHMSTSPASASNANWYWDLIGISSQNDLVATLNEVEQHLMNEDRPLFFPYLFGAPAGMAPGASFVGIRGWHSKFDIAASVLEGIVFNHKHHFDILSEKLDTSKRIVATGGSMQSPVWSQLVADVFNREIELSDTQESGARGVALLAGVSIGKFNSVESAIKSAVRIKGTVKPNSERKMLFMNRYSQYRIESKRITGV